ncbi:MAG: hypothetical protein AAGE52_18575 [Myxococcota bacterium]
MSRRRIAIIAGGVVVFALAVLLRPRPEGSDGPDRDAGLGAADAGVEARPRWDNGEEVVRPELYPAEFEFETSSLEVELPAAIEPLEDQLCRPLVTSLCEARQRCGCGTEALDTCKERELSLCRRSLACGYLDRELERTIDAERLRQCIAGVRETLETCNDDRLPDVCYRVLISPVDVGEACPPEGRWCRNGACVNGRCERAPDLGQPCLLVETPGVIPFEESVCQPPSVCGVVEEEESQGEPELRCISPADTPITRCGKAADCPSGRACIGGNCGTPRHVGEPCDGNDACEPQLTCREGVCRDADRCRTFRDCGIGQECTGTRVARCTARVGEPLGASCEITRECTHGAVCTDGVCVEAPGPGEEPILGRCNNASIAPRHPGGRCRAKRIRARGESCGRGVECGEGLACVRRTALDGGINLPGMECVTGFPAGTECDLQASRCAAGLRCEPEYPDGRCRSMLCSSFADIWACEGAPSLTDGY